MKFIICTLAILLAVVAVNCNDDHKKVFQECKTEAGLTDEKANIDDPKHKCFHACLMKKMGKMADGKIVPEKVIEFYTKHVPNADASAKEKITECAAAANKLSGDCEVAGAMVKCVFEKVGPPPQKN